MAAREQAGVSSKAMALRPRKARHRASNHRNQTCLIALGRSAGAQAFTSVVMTWGCGAGEPAHR